MGPPVETLDWNLLKSFCFVARSGAVSRAAKALGLSQPTVSRQIAELEEAIDAALFERVARGVALTAAGRALQGPAEAMLGAAQAVSVAAAAQGQSQAGTVRITASEVMSAFVLPRVLAGLRLSHPQIQIELTASNQIENLLTREADIAVRMTRPAQGGVVARKLGDYPLGLYASKEYLKAHPGARRTRDPAQLDWIGLDRSSQMIDGFRQAGWTVDREFFNFRCDDQIVGVHAMLAGLGAGVTLERVARDYPQLVRVLPQQPLPALEVWLVAHRELRDVARIRTVFDFLAAALG